MYNRIISQRGNVKLLMQNKIEMTERQSQICVIEYLRKHKDKPLYYAVPNGGSRHKIEAANLKREGVMPGVPDICICEPRGAYHGLYIEMKSKKGRVSDSQRNFQVALADRGYDVHVCYGASEAIEVIDDYLKLDWFDDKFFCCKNL